MPLSSFIKINDKRYKFEQFKAEVKDIVHDKIVKLRATNGIENIAIVLDDNDDKGTPIGSLTDPKQANNKVNYYNYNTQHAYYVRNQQKLLQYQHERYLLNRKDVLQKKKEYNKQPEVKQHNSEYHKNYYLDHKQELTRKNKERYKNRKKLKI